MKKFYSIISGLILAIALGIGGYYLMHWKLKKERRYDKFIMEAAQRYQLEPALIKAVVWKESKFDEKARGGAGEIGLMQVREDAAFEWAAAEKFPTFDHEAIVEARKNILCGSFYLSKLLKRYQNTDNPIPYALADYNAGRTHVLRWNKGAAKTNYRAFLNQMDYPGTRTYALQVMEKHRDFADDFPAIIRKR